jgi:hypothetical protein
MAGFRQALIQHKTSGAGYTGATSKYFSGSTEHTGMAADTGGSGSRVVQPVSLGGRRRGTPGNAKTPLGGRRY